MSIENKNYRITPKYSEKSGDGQATLYKKSMNEGERDGPQASVYLLD